MLIDVKKLCGRYIAASPHRSEDILQAAYLGYYHGIDNYQGSKDDLNYLCRYLNICVRRMIMEFVESDSVVPIPRKEYKRRREDELFIPVVGEMHELPARGDPLDDIVYNETRSTLIGDKVDESIVGYLEQGYSMRECATIIGISHVAVSKRANKMRERVMNMQMVDYLGRPVPRDKISEHLDDNGSWVRCGTKVITMLSEEADGEVLNLWFTVKVGPTRLYHGVDEDEAVRTFLKGTK